MNIEFLYYVIQYHRAMMKIKINLFQSVVLLTAILSSCTRSSEVKDANWPVYLGDNSSSQYSTLKQININNVQNLEVAWTYNTGDSDSLNRTQIQCNPLIIDGVLYGSSPKLKFFALDAVTGKQKWVIGLLILL